MIARADLPRVRLGRSKLELSISVVIITFVAIVGLNRFAYVEEFSEMTVVEATVRNVRSGLRYAMAEKVIQGEEIRIAEFLGTNPVEWLTVPPAGYVGELPQAPGALGRGTWAFDRASRELVYRPRLALHLTVEAAEPVLRWRIEPTGGRDLAGRMGGVRVVSVVPYRWFEEMPPTK